MKEPRLSDQIDAFIDEWQATIKEMRAAVDRKDFESIAPNIVFLKGLDIANYVNRDGFHHLKKAAQILLARRRLDLKITERSARQCLIDALNSHLPKARKTGVISDAAIIDGAKSRMDNLTREDGTYVFTARLAPLAKTTDFSIGPIRIVSKVRFLREYAEALRGKWPDSKETHKFLLKKWIAYLKHHDHLILVDMFGFEQEMGWAMAREIAEFALNLIRMLFRFSHTDRIRLGGEFAVERNRSSLIISPSRDTWMSHSTDRIASVLEDGWMNVFDRELRPFSLVLSSYATWLASGTHSGNPISERLRYAHRLIAESYCEPSDFLRLVRLISALESLALVTGNDKAHRLSLNCANAGGWGDPQKALDIIKAVRGAYHWRNAIVHGDAPSALDVREAFFSLEKYLLEIILGFMTLYVGIAHNVAPKSVKTLRRELDARIEMFFWAPSLVT